MTDNSDDRPLYERDPVAWQAYLAEGNAKQARKRVGADVLIRDEQGNVLLVNPSYKPDWDLPGGMAEANEPPDHAAEREMYEEMGIRLRVGRLLVIDWVAPHGPWDDSLMFVFDGGVLRSDETAALRLADGELLEYRLSTADDAKSLLRPHVWHRLSNSLAAAALHTCRYLVNGSHPPDNG
ncbi:NUDIX domain-containing protein [Micromonospora humida]|uniref:NUDIX hydrolase n=1 Tax=Micromonospora humida TaxID=2809018 RepID=A0ABS2J0E4_9ACTN|nr:NUDIX hydrolase [Micromonospora humida]MBM7080032.1 NUDIX hydrolase [Micromonospora humida]